MRKVVLPSKQQTKVETQSQNLQIVPTAPEGTPAKVDTGVAERVETRTEATTPEGTLVTEAHVDALPASKAALISTPD